MSPDDSITMTPNDSVQALIEQQLPQVASHPATPPQRDETTFAQTQEVLMALNGLAESAPRFRLDLTPKLVAAMRAPIAAKNLVVTHIVVGSEAWGNIVASKDFTLMLDPTSRVGDVLGGRVGQLFGADLLTDAFFSPDSEDNERHIPTDMIVLVSFVDGKLRDFTCAHVF